MKKKYKLITILSISLLAIWAVPCFVSADGSKPISITLNADNFQPGQEIKAEAQFFNTFPIKVEGKMELFFEDYANQSSANLKIFHLDVPAKGQSGKMEIGKTVAKSDAEGLWKIVAVAKDKSGTLVARREKIFTITGTEKIINAEIKTCADKACAQPKTVFTKNEKVYLALDTNVAGFSASATVQKKGDDDSQKITLDSGGGEIASLDEGGYMLNILLEKEGYSPLTIQKDFAVISEEPDFSSAMRCNRNGKCGAGETADNCPDDCALAGIASNRNVLIIVVLASLALILGLTLFWFRHKRSRPDDSGKNQDGIDKTIANQP